MTKIAIYGENSRGSGIGNYGSELVSHLQKDTEFEIDLFDHATLPVPLVGNYFDQTVFLGSKLRAIDQSSDIIHLTSQTQAASLLSYQPQTPVVVTVHDIIPFVSSYDSIPNRLYSHLFVRGLWQADHLIAISQHTKSDLQQHLGISDDNIDVVYPAVEAEAYAELAPKTALRDIGVQPPYLLFVGSRGRKKNFPVVYRALNDLPSEIDIVVAGKAGNPIQNYWDRYQARRAGVEDRVIRPGFVSQPALSRLYDSALAFVFPSKYEGFGRPPLEAMVNSTPVIASTATAVPEVLGGGALFCDPDTPSEWSQMIEAVYERDTLRQKLQSKGALKVNQYSWKRTAEKTASIYNKVL